MSWPNWAPPDDIEIASDRHTAPIAPNPIVGPDTDLLLSVAGHDPGRDPMALLPPYRMRGDNADIPSKGIAGIGPQSGDALNMLDNQGTQILPGWQRYLEMGGQKEVGVLPRTVPVEHDQLWDSAFVLNPAVEAV